jgi:hypothetical protein
MISTVSSFRRYATENSIGWRGDPALRDRAKIISTLRVAILMPLSELRTNRVTV